MHGVFGIFSGQLFRKRFLSRVMSALSGGLALILLVWVGMVSGRVNAQTTDAPPDYSVTAGITLNSSRDALDIIAGVVNNGGPSSTTAEIQVLALDGAGEERVVASEQVRPLDGNNDRISFVLRVPVDQFEPGTQQVFVVRVIGLPDTPEIRSSLLSANIPITAGTGGNAVTTPAPPTPTAPVTPPASIDRSPTLTIPLIDVTIDLNDREQVALLLTVVACVLLLLLLIIRLLRLLFVRRPDFKIPWQPPYATVPPLDPYSAPGVRQAWQPLAQNNLISTPPTQGALQSIKLLLGTDGRYLSGWQLQAARLIQYDQYGRVSRTETLMSPQAIKRLNQLIRSNQRLSFDQMMRRVRPTARTLIRQFRKRVTARSAMLPIALDIRLKGKHGEVNIVFELFHFDQGYWQLIDRWQPEMMIVSKSVQENYTYSLFGQSGGEKLNDFFRRLTEDLTRTLVDFVGSQPELPPETAPDMPAADSGAVPAVGAAVGAAGPAPQTADNADEPPITTQGEKVHTAETGDQPPV